MVAAALQSPLSLNRGSASDREVGDFRTAFEKCAPAGGYVSGANPAVDTVSAAVTDGSAAANVSADTAGTTIGYGLAVQSGVPGSSLMFGTSFGMDPREYAGWWYKGGGEAAMAAAIAAQGTSDIIARLGALRSGESGGWWKEPITFKMMDEGKYSDGTPLRLRLFGDAQAIMNRAFPNVVTPGATAGTSPLDDFKGGNFNALEFGMPELDAYSGLFPSNVDDGGGALDEVKLAGSIIEAGAKHYYISSFWQPVSVHDFWLNKTWYDALSADDKLRIDTACMRNALNNFALAHYHQGFLINQFKALGVTIHVGWPHDVLEHLRMATEEIYEEAEVADGTGAFAIIQDSMKAYVKDEQVRTKYYQGDLSRRWGSGFDLWRSNTSLG